MCLFPSFPHLFETRKMPQDPHHGDALRKGDRWIGWSMAMARGSLRRSKKFIESSDNVGYFGEPNYYIIYNNDSK